jgi:ABC-type phosphate transport system substrate-binding protein
MYIRLKFRRADEGRVRVTIFVDEKELAQGEGYLIGSLDETKSSLYQWQEGYLGLEDVALRINPIRVTEPVSRDEVAKFYESLRQNFNEWLSQGDRQWLMAREKLAKILDQAHKSENEICIFIDVKEGDLRRFPWTDWEFFQHNCQDAEIALCQVINPPRNPPLSDSVKVLVVVGKTENIEPGIRADIEAIKQLEQEKKGVFTILEQPSPSVLIDELRNHIYEIFIFTGHSGSDNDKNIGWIYLSDTDSLRLADLKGPLNAAIRKRLRLCIFNSCDGLGLAKQLAEWQLPLAIVMREPIPDLVAARFLRVFLQNFSGGQSFFKSFREAREQLEGFNGKYPGVCGLPIVCIGNSVAPPTWKKLGGSNNWKRLLLPGVAFLLLAVYVVIPKPSPTSTIAVIPNTTEIKYIKDIQPPQPSGEMRYGGSNLGQKLANAIQIAIKDKEAFPHIKFRESFNGTKTSLIKFNNKQLDFMFASEGVNALNSKPVTIAHDAIAVVVNPKLSVKSLTMDDLRNIITGKVTDWKNIPNSNVTSSIPIQVYYRNEGTTEFLKDTLLKNKSDRNKAFKGNNFFEITDPKSPLTEAKNKVQNDPGGVSFVTASLAVASCEFKPIPIIGDHKTMAIEPYQDQLIPRDDSGICASKQKQKPDKVNIEAIKHETYPIIRPFFLILRTDDQKARQWGEYYLNVLKTNEGKKLILETGFLPILETGKY